MKIFIEICQCFDFRIVQLSKTNDEKNTNYICCITVISYVPVHTHLYANDNPYPLKNTELYMFLL